MPAGNDLSGFRHLANEAAIQLAHRVLSMFLVTNSLSVFSVSSVVLTLVCPFLQQEPPNNTKVHERKKLLALALSPKRGRGDFCYRSFDQPARSGGFVGDSPVPSLALQASMNSLFFSCAFLPLVANSLSVSTAVD
jgi:hypothetical protein